MRSHQELDLKVTQLDNDVHEIYGMLSDIQETQTDHTSRLDRIEREHGAKLDEHGAKLDEHGAKLDEHGAKLDQILALLTPGADAGSR